MLRSHIRAFSFMVRYPAREHMADCPPVTGSLSEVTSSGNVTTATVTDLFIYPVKSTRGIARERVRIAATGFEWDRQWMIIDHRGTFLSQRTHPHLAQIVPQVAPDALILRHARLATLTVPFTEHGERVAVSVHRDACVGIDQGTAASEWVSAALGQAVRLVRVPGDPARRANPKFAGPAAAPMGFADGFPMLVCNQASLDDLNQRMPAPIPMERFRPNIVLEGLPPWAEDHIDTVTVGALVTANQTNVLATIDTLDPIYVDINQSTAELLTLKKSIASGQVTGNTPESARVSLTLEDGSKYPLDGTLKFSEASVDPNTGAVVLRAVFPNPNGMLLPGMYVRARIVEGIDRRAILAPQQGISRDEKGNPTALIVDGKGIVRLKVLQAPRAIGGFWLVTAGLEPGDRLIVDGLQNARPGQKVQAVPASIPKAPPASAT